MSQDVQVQAGVKSIHGVRAGFRLQEISGVEGLAHTHPDLCSFGACILLASPAQKTCLPLLHGLLCTVTSVWTRPLCHFSRSELFS